MSLSVDQLIQIPTREQLVQDLLDLLASLGFEVTAWQPGSVPRALIEAFAHGLRSQIAVQSAMAKASFTEESSGEWLTLRNVSFYDEERKPGRRTRGIVRLSCAAVSGPYTIDGAANQVAVRDANHGYIYRTLTGGTLTSGGFLDVTVEAEVAGSDRDVATGTITEVVTSLAGVTCANPAPSGASTWITVHGADEESDAEYYERCRTKWASLGAGGPGGAYAHFVLEADLAVKRVHVDASNPRGPGTVDVYLAGDTGPSGPSVVATVQSYLDGGVDGIKRTAPHMSLTCFAAQTALVTIAGQVFILAAANTPANQTKVRDAIAAYFGALPLGGTKLSAGSTGYVLLADLHRVILTAVAGVVNVAFTAPTGDVALSSAQVAIFDAVGLTFSSV